MEFAAYVGLDWADQKHAVCLESADGKILEEFELDRLDALGRFLLKRMHDPNVIAELDAKNHTKGIAPECQGDLEYACSEAVHGFRDVGLAAFCCDRQGSKTD